MVWVKIIKSSRVKLIWAELITTKFVKQGSAELGTAEYKTNIASKNLGALIYCINNACSIAVKQLMDQLFYLFQPDWSNF